MISCKSRTPSWQHRRRSSTKRRYFFAEFPILISKDHSFQWKIILLWMFYGQVVCSWTTLPRTFWHKAEKFAVNLQNWWRKYNFFPKKSFSQVSKRHVVCSFDYNCEQFLPEGWKLSDQFPKTTNKIIVFYNCLILKVIFWTHRMQL